MAEHTEDDDDIRQEVLDIVREILEIDEEETSDERLAGQTLRELGATGETRTLIAEKIERDLEVEVPDSVINKRGLTVQELANQVITLLDEE